MIKKIRFDNFSAFDDLEINFSPGVNLFIGENGTGKTNILKAIYAASDITKSKKDFAEKINDVFYPSGKQIGRLVKRSNKSSSGHIELKRTLASEKEISIRLSLTSHMRTADKATVTGSTKQWLDNPIESVFIPVKDMMANAPGFSSLFSHRDLHFEEIYADIIDRAFLPSLRGPMDKERIDLLNILQSAIDGRVVTKNQEFFLKNKQGELEFTLLAEGFRKLGLLWLLIQNGTLLSGSVLCWDEPEANLNPNLIGTVVKILLKLQRLGVQIFVATHDYFLLKEFDLSAEKEDQIIYHSLYRDKDSAKIMNSNCNTFEDLAPNSIDDTFGSIIDRQIKMELGELGK